MSDSDEDLSEFVTSYVTSNVKESFKKQMLLTSKLVDPSVVVEAKSYDKFEKPYRNLEERERKWEEEIAHIQPPVSSKVCENTDDEDNHINRAITNKASPIKETTSSMTSDLPPIKTADKVMNYDSDSVDEICSLVPSELLDNTRSWSPEIQEVGVSTQTAIGRYFTRSKKPRRSSLKRQVTSPSKKRKRRNVAVDTVTLDCTPAPPTVPVQTEGEDTFDEFNCETNVKVLWQSNKIVKVVVRRLQKFDVVFNHLASTESVPVDRIVLSLNGANVKPTDTPHSLDLKITDFIDGGVVSVESYRSSSTKNSTGARKFDLKIKFQCSDKKCVSLGALKGDNMKILMVAFAEQIDKPLSELRFMFDGVRVVPEDTPQQLDMENNDVIDVIID